VHWFVFGPTNVAVHRVTALVDQDKHADAASAASSLVIPDDWPVMRAGQYHVDVARAQMWTGRTDAAFKSLLMARQLAPQQTRYHPQVRETLFGLLSAKRKTPETLANYAAWVGV
jgi:hypothetical protein